MSQDIEQLIEDVLDGVHLDKTSRSLWLKGLREIVEPGMLAVGTQVEVPRDVFWMGLDTASGDSMTGFHLVKVDPIKMSEPQTPDSWNDAFRHGFDMTVAALDRGDVVPCTEWMEQKAEIASLKAERDAARLDVWREQQNVLTMMRKEQYLVDEIARLHDLLGRAGASFREIHEPAAVQTTTKAAPMPASALRDRPQDIGLRTP